MTTAEEKTQTQQDEAAKGPLITTGQSSTSGMVNNLIPPLGTMYYGQQTHTFLNNNVVGTDAAGHFGTVSWSADIYTYGTGGVDPKDPNFAADGGLLYIIMVHRASVQIYSDYSADLPSTGSESISGDNYNYSINFEQSMQMLQNGGNEQLLFDAKYQQSFSPVQAKQSSSTSNCIQFRLNTTGSANDHRNTEISALSMFTHKNPSQFTVNPGFSFDINGHEHWAIGGGWSLSLPF
ncbi:hypothetical protein BDN71DRAFT_1508794 [Pleurotus eryngii]|uniref:Uncharacterized protein n=1 Tax=Pleurotus eryngii TaxID=5323 RepID=A0A9P5ZT51_PLEER|nr:hypothetical protein BDN71DRAFT_1508794 [Pleurotus eryngii]